MTEKALFPVKHDVAACGRTAFWYEGYPRIGEAFDPNRVVRRAIALPVEDCECQACGALGIPGRTLTGALVLRTPCTDVARRRAA